MVGSAASYCSVTTLWHSSSCGDCSADCIVGSLLLSTLLLHLTVARLCLQAVPSFLLLHKAEPATHRTQSGLVSLCCQLCSSGFVGTACLQGEWLSPRVLNLCLQYLSHALTLSATWKHMKQHTNNLLTRCVLPLMCFNDEDDELWRDDPHEYIRKVPLLLLGILFYL